MVSAYQVRGLARIQQNNFAGAIEDYTKALEFAPENIGVWHNMALAVSDRRIIRGRRMIWIS